MESPDYLICVNCETPCYTFAYTGGLLSEAMCMACGSDELEEFVTEEEFEALTAE